MPEGSWPWSISTRAQRTAAHRSIRPPVPVSQNAAIVGTEYVVAVTYGSDFAVAQHRAHFLPAAQKSQFMIDQCEHACFARALSHTQGLGGVHGHWLFAKHSLALCECGERNFHVR